MTRHSATDLAAAIDAQANEAAARRRATGLHQAELVKRRRLALELVAELKRPLVERHGPSDLETLAAMSPHPRPAR